MGKGERRVTFGAVPLFTVFRYYPDMIRGRTRVKLTDDLCCTEEWYAKHGKEFSNDDAWEGLCQKNSVFRAEAETRVRVLPCDQMEVE